jgi:DNA-binding beta-propeller fold protein YncE
MRFSAVSIGNRNLAIAGGLVSALAALGAGQLLLGGASAAQEKGVEAPTFEVDPFWPKPLPNNWVIGSTIGITVDSRDHVFVIHRHQSLNRSTEVSAAASPPTAPECCVPAPPVLEFDPGGDLVGHWGGPGQGYDWPESNHGITIDPMDNIWIGGNGEADSHILKFTRDGKFLKQFGRPGVRRDPKSSGSEAKYVSGSNDRENFGRVAKISFDAAGKEAFIADGYLNRRVAVLDGSTGAFKRYWGAYGNKPEDGEVPLYRPDAPPAKQFRNPVHCAEPSSDGLLYVCDRASNRIQVFRLGGEYVNEVVVAPESLGSGAVWDIAFSRDPEQKYLYLADGKNEKIYIIDRKKLEVLTSFGAGGRQPGQFYGVHSIATDSKGNLYSTETYEGKRIQKFVYKGMAPVRAKDQGVLWPKTSE